MIKLYKIYFDGKSYARDMSQEKEFHSQEEIDFIKNFDFAIVESISFIGYSPQTYCDITIDDNFIQAVNITYLYTNIEKPKAILYPSHNPSHLY